MPSALGTTGAHGIWSPSAAGLTQLRRFAQLSGVGLPTLVADIRRSVLRSPFAPAVVVARPTGGLIDYLAERASSYPAFKWTGQPSRTYPQGALGAEFLGLLGEVSQNELGTKRYASAKPGQIVGQSGVEATYDSVLSPGFLHAHLRVDSLGRIAGPLEYAHGKTPPTLRLTIDARVQRAAEKAIRDGMALAQANGHSDATSAAAVVMNPRTGGIYALASYPTYNQVAAANDPAYRNALYHSTSPNPPLLNLATQGLYPTGSTFKPIVAEAALTQGLITPYDQPALQRLVHARQLHLPQRRGRRLLVHAAAHGARGVVRHVVLPARQPLLPARARRHAISACRRGRTCSGSDSRPASTSPARWAASCRRRAG